MTHDSPAFPPSYLEKCPSCDRPLAEHLFVDRRLAREALAAESHAADFDEGHWVKFAEQYPAARSGEETVLRILRCPGGGGSLVPLALAPTVLQDDRIVGLVLCVDAGDIDGLAAAMPHSWEAYSATWVSRADGRRSPNE